MLSQGGAAAQPSMNVMGMLNTQAPALPQASHQGSNHQGSNYGGGSGIGQSIIKQLVGDFFQDRQDKKTAENDKINTALTVDYISKAPPNQTPMERALYLLGAPTEEARKWGGEGMAEILKNQINPKNVQTLEGGSVGDSSLLQQYGVGPGGVWAPLNIPPRKSSAGVEINMGDKLPPPGVGYRWNKEGTEQTIIPGGAADPVNKGLTEDQGKTSQNLELLNRSKESLLSVLSTRNMDIKSNMKDYAGSTLVNTDIPVLKDIGKSMESDNQQIFDQAAAGIKTAVVHMLSGAGFSNTEIETKVKAVVPVWGESEAAIKAKFDAIEGLAKSGAARSRNKTTAPAAPPPPPKVGEVMDGYMYIGGDPAKQENWRLQ
jgi:hypothetical protein